MNNDTNTFSSLGVAEPLCRALAGENYTRPTPIQARAIPPLLEGRDVIGIAQTGTGKTAAFALPMLQILQGKHAPAVARSARALVLAPTRELALQIGEAIRTYARHLGQNPGLRLAVILGGVGQQRQVRAMAGGVDILIATPGRLLDLVGQGHVRLDKVSFLVLDEADRMLDMGFIRDVRRIVEATPKARQSLLFSATMPAEVARLASDMLREPVRIEVSPQSMTVEKVDQRVFHVRSANKRALLTELLRDRKFARVIVFTRTKHGAGRLSKQLVAAGVAADAIHGNKSQNARQRALELFKSGRTRVLVATDVAARGIDVDDVTHVVNFELPNVPESYVHRIGRTARAGAGGVALSFCDPAERAFLGDIEKLTKRRLAVAQHSRADLDASSAPSVPPTHPRRGNDGRGRRSRRRHRRRAA